MPSLGKHLRAAAEKSEQSSRKLGKRNRQKWMERINVEDMLDKLGVNNVSQASAGNVQFSCPFPGHDHGDSTPSAYMNDGSKDESKTGLWKCHGCGREGNAVSFLAEHENISRQDATRRLRDEYAPDFLRPKDGIRAEFETRYAKLRERRSNQGDTALVVLDWNEYDRFHVGDWDDYTGDEGPEVAYMFDRGFTAHTLNTWQIGYDEISERITIPVCDRDGNLVGIKGRMWRKPRHKREKKYQILGDTEKTIRRFGKRYGFAPYEKSLIIFGAHMVPAGTRVLVIVEGELDAITLWQMGIPAVCTGSAHLSDVQSKIIRSLCDEVVIWYDEGKAGHNATWGYENSDNEWKPGLVERLEPFMRVRVVSDNSDDPNKLYVDGKQARIKRIIEDAEWSARL